MLIHLYLTGNASHLECQIKAERQHLINKRLSRRTYLDPRQMNPWHREEALNMFMFPDHEKNIPGTKHYISAITPNTPGRTSSHESLLVPQA